jgi:serine protease AprX
MREEKVNMRSTLRLILAILLACFVSYGDSRFKVSRDFDQMDQNQATEVIVQFRQAPTDKHHKKVKDKGGEFKRDLHVIKGALYSIPPGQVKKLADDPDVVFMSPNRKVKGSLDVTTAAANAGAAASYGLDGTGVGIAILDSGVSAHPDLRKSGTSISRIVYSQDFTGSGTTDDLYGHGTHVAGIAAGNGKVALLYPTVTRILKGMASQASIINLKVLDDDGVGLDSAVIEAIQTAIALKSQYNIRVMNLSLGRGVFDSYTQDPLCQAVEQAWNAGIVVVVAAGNYGRNDSAGTSGYGTIAAPGNDPYVITVGAMKTMGTAGRGDDLIASYSSKGPTLFDHVVKPDIVAPGNQVRSLLNSTTGTIYSKYYSARVSVAYYATGYGYSYSSAYLNMSGTSMATPVVSGAVALLLQQHPSLTPDQVKARLMKTASKSFPTMSSTVYQGVTYVSYYDAFTVGAGYLDVAAALANTDVAAGSAQSPVAVRDAVTGQVSMVYANGVIWGSGLIWGSGVIWGSTNVGSSGLIWGSGVIWGSTMTGGTGLIWGSGTNGTVDPAGIIWGSSGRGLVDPMSVVTEGEN